MLYIKLCDIEMCKRALSLGSVTPYLTVQTYSWGPQVVFCHTDAR